MSNKILKHHNTKREKGRIGKKKRRTVHHSYHARSVDLWVPLVFHRKREIQLITLEQEMLSIEYRNKLASIKEVWCVVWHLIITFYFWYAKRSDSILIGILISVLNFTKFNFHYISRLNAIINQKMLKEKRRAFGYIDCSVWWLVDNLKL